MDLKTCIVGIRLLMQSTIVSTLWVKSDGRYVACHRNRVIYMTSNHYILDQWSVSASTELILTIEYTTYLVRFGPTRRVTHYRNLWALLCFTWRLRYPDHVPTTNYFGYNLVVYSMDCGPWDIAFVINP